LGAGGQGRWDALFGVMLSRRDSRPDQGPKWMVPPHEICKAGGMHRLDLGSLGGRVDLREAEGDSTTS
jgi:hypothetical protein